MTVFVPSFSVIVLWSVDILYFSEGKWRMMGEGKGLRDVDGGNPAVEMYFMRENK